MPCSTMYIPVLPFSSFLSVFEDKSFLKEDHEFAVNLFQDVPPFLLSQILGLTMDQWKAIEAVDVKNEPKQLSNVIKEWGKSSDTAKWSVLVETLIELGLRGMAQMASVEKGLPAVVILYTSYNINLSHKIAIPLEFIAGLVCIPFHKSLAL